MGRHSGACAIRSSNAISSIVSPCRQLTWLPRLSRVPEQLADGRPSRLPCTQPAWTRRRTRRSWARARQRRPRRHAVIYTVSPFSSHRAGSRPGGLAQSCAAAAVGASLCAAAPRRASAVSQPGPRGSRPGAAAVCAPARPSVRSLFIDQ